MEKITSKQYAAKIVEVAYHEVLPNKETVCNIVTALIDEYTNSKHKWIKVKDELPEKEDIYLVECKDDYTAKFNTYGNFKGSFTNCDNNGYDYEVYPTHWMPLPSKPLLTSEA